MGRKDKLLNTIGSIGQALTLVEDKVWVYVYYSSKEEFNRDSIGYKQYPWILTRLLEKPYKASEFWNDHLKESHADIVIYANDDIIMEIQSLKKVVNIFNAKFPDGDGLVGIKQSNLPPNQALQTAFGAIGNKFTERFPDKKVFCENYERFFLDKELYLYSTKIDKLYFDEKDGPELKHLHPAFYKEMLDDTHIDVRRHLNKDKIMFNRRQSLGLLWGESFTLL